MVWRGFVVPFSNDVILSNKMDGIIEECTNGIIKIKIPKSHMKDDHKTLPQEKPKRKWFSFLKRDKN